MALDADAAQMIALLKQVMPSPGPGDDVAAYRAMLAAGRAERAPLDVDHVETFSIPGPGGPLRMRLFAHGPEQADRPTLIYFHGGGFVACSIDSHDYFCRRLALASGWRLLSVDYRLAPEHPFPAAVEDGYAALLWAASAEGTEKGIVANLIAVGGDSAGGGIATVISLMARDRGGPSILHQLLIYPVTDCAFDTPSYRENGSDYFLTEGQMRWFWGHYLGTEGDPAHPYASPNRAPDLSGLPPATIITAGYDPLRDEAAYYAERLKNAGVATTYRCFDSAFHGFAGLDTLSSSGQALGLMAETLRSL